MRRLLATGLTALLLLPTSPVSACTIFMASRGGAVLVGNNEDWTNPNTHMWVVPAKGKRYGVLHFGFDDGSPQGGVNERGLCFDGASVPVPEPATTRGKKKTSGWIFDRIMRECATVVEALALLENYDVSSLESAQILLADREGDSAIVERNHVIRRSGDYQIATNFRQSRIEPAVARCERFRTANQALSGTGPISVELFRTLLDKTHQERPSSTLYSNIYDLRAGEVHLYLARDYSRAVKINVREELARGKHRLTLKSLFAAPPQRP